MSTYHKLFQIFIQLLFFQEFSEICTLPINLLQNCKSIALSLFREYISQTISDFITTFIFSKIFRDMYSSNQLTRICKTTALSLFREYISLNLIKINSIHIDHLYDIYILINIY
jgi:hypothetical protein